MEKLLDYEGITQKHMVSCGAAVATQVLDILKIESAPSQEDLERKTRMYGKGENIAKILDKVGMYDSISKKYRNRLGTSLPAMQSGINHYLKDKHIEAQIKEGASIEEIKASIDKGFPVTCLFLGQGGANPFDMNKEEHKGTYGRHYVVVVGYDDNNIKIRNPLGFKEDIPTQEFYKRRNLNLKYLSLHKSSESGFKDLIKENMFPEHQKRRDYVINKYEIPEEQQTNALLENLIIREYLAKPRSAIFIEPKKT